MQSRSLPCDHQYALGIESLVEENMAETAKELALCFPGNSYSVVTFILHMFIRSCGPSHVYAL